MTLKIAYVKRRSGTIRSKQLQGALMATLLNTQKRAYKSLMKYISTWRHKPYFETSKGIKYAGGDISVGISTDDPEFWWLEMGTRVRYAVMQDNFQPKTAPGQIQSKSGANPDYAYIDMKNPRPGIEPRRIGETISREESEKFREDILKVVLDIDFLGMEGLVG